MAGEPSISFLKSVKAQDTTVLPWVTVTCALAVAFNKNPISPKKSGASMVWVLPNFAKSALPSITK